MGELTANKAPQSAAHWAAHMKTLLCDVMADFMKHTISRENQNFNLLINFPVNGASLAAGKVLVALQSTKPFE